MRKGPLLTCRTSHTITFSFKPQRWVTYICSTGKHNVWRGTVKWGHKYAEPRINTFSPWLLGYRIEAAQIKQTLTRPLLNERGIELHIQRLPQPLIELMTCSNTLLSASSYSKNRSCKKKKKIVYPIPGLFLATLPSPYLTRCNRRWIEKLSATPFQLNNMIREIRSGLIQAPLAAC